MNQIGQSFLPIATASNPPSGPEPASNQMPDGHGSFASLLQQRSEEPLKVSDAAPVIESEMEPTKPDNRKDASDALISAGLIAMVGLPAIVPLPAPIQTQPQEGVISDSSAESGSKDVTTVSPEALSPNYSQSTDVAAAALPGPAAPVLNVGTVRGIIPPVQNAPAIPDEATFRSPAIPTVAAAEIMESAIPATTPETVPATFTGKVTQPITAENKTSIPETPAASTTAAAVQISGKIAAISRTETFSGMAAATPGRAMSAPTILRSQSSTPATPAEVSQNGAASVVASLVESPSLRHAPVLATENGRERSANEHSENPDNPLVPTPEFLQTTFSSGSTPSNAITASTAHIQPADVAQVVNHTLAAAERLRASGQEHVNIALKLEGGQELTIQLRVANGQVTPIIRTESESLRLALEQNWSQFSQRSGDRELQVTKPVFESPQTSSNMTDLNQQRDGRQRTFQEPSGSFAQQYLPRRAPTPGASQPISITSTPQTGVRLYA